MPTETQQLLGPPRGQVFFDLAKQHWDDLINSYLNKGTMDYLPFSENEVQLYFKYKENIQKAIAAGHPQARPHAASAATFLYRRAARLDTPIAIIRQIPDRKTHIEEFKREADELSGRNSCCCTLT